MTLSGAEKAINHASAYVIIFTASISFLSSITLGKSIVGSSGGLKTPIRRILFAATYFNLFQCCALIFGPFASPFSEKSPLGIGNRVTCDAQAFVLVASVVGTPLYTCLLSYYYYCKLRRDMSDETFSRQIERKAHAGILVYVCVMSVPGLLASSYSTFTTGTFCGIAVVPNREFCQQYPELIDEDKKCGRAIAIYFFYFVQYMLVLMFSITFISRNVILLWCNLSKGCTSFLCQAERKVPMAPPVQINDAHLEVSAEGRIAKNSTTQEISNAVDLELLEGAEQEDGPQEEEEILETPAETRIRAAMTQQASLYIAGFAFVYTPFLVHLGIVAFGGKDPLSLIFLISAIIHPLGGLLNILVFTRPSVWILQERHSLSWFKAFRLVIREGGEIPQNYAQGSPPHTISPLRNPRQSRRFRWSSSGTP
jgi:hypothetical protein